MVKRDEKTEEPERGTDIKDVLEDLSQQAERHRANPESLVKSTLKTEEKELQSHIKETVDQLASQAHKVKEISNPEKLIKEETKEKGGFLSGITSKLTGVFHLGGKQETTETETTQKQSVGDKISGGLHGLEDKLTGHVEHVQEKIAHKKEEKDAKAFHKVEGGFDETVTEYKHEKHVEEFGTETVLATSNPFEALADPSIKLAQPLDNQDVVGGQNVVKMTEKVQPGSIEGPAQVSEDKAELKDKSMMERLQAKLGEGQDMVKSKFSKEKQE